MFEHLQSRVSASQRRWPGLLISTLLHLGLIATAPFWNSTLWELDQILSDSVEETIEANRRNQKLIWYKLPPTPSIRNSTAQTQREKAQGEKLSANQIVVEREMAQSAQQLIENAEAREQLEKEVAAPNQVEKTAAAEAPLPKQPSRKAPMPDSPPRQMAEVMALEPPPTLTASASPLTAAAMLEVARLRKPQAKVFTPPAEERRNSTPASLQLDDVPTLTNSSQTLADAGAVQVARLPKPAPRKFPTPLQAQRISPRANLDISDVPIMENGSQSAAQIGQLQVAKLPKPAPKKFVAPERNGGAGNDKPSMAIDPESLPLQGANEGRNTPLNGNAGVAGGMPRLPRRKLDPATLAGNGAGSSAKGRSITANLESPPELQTPTGTGSGGRNQSDLSVIGLNPQPGKIPPGVSLQGSFSRGATVGPPEHPRNNDPKATSLAGVSSLPSLGEIQNLKLASPEQILGNEVAEGYLEVRLDLRKQWPKLSVPLSPHTRMLPRKIEPFFRGRSTFAVVVPMERMDRYTADWILWFSPNPTSGQEAVVGNNTRVEAPLPIWKLESKRWLVSRAESGTEERVQLHIEISREGRVRIKQLLGRYSLELNQLFTNDLSRWVFEPARLGGRTIDVEAIVEVPFRIPNSIARTNP